MNIPVTAAIGELLTEIRDDLVKDVQRRVADAGYGDVRSSHDCVFRHLTPDGLRLRDLASYSNMSPQAIGEHVDELEALGYVERIRDPSDRRAKLITPTARGAAFMRAAYEALGQIEREWADVVGADALGRLHDALARVRSLQRGTEPQ
jgi:DNA-binding MarR family transcriptional regulator